MFKKLLDKIFSKKCTFSKTIKVDVVNISLYILGVNALLVTTF